MRKWIPRLLILVGIIAIFVLARRTVFAPQPIEVRVEPAARGTVEATVTNSRAGTVKARRRAKLSPEIGGQAVEIPFREGETVRSGDVVLRLDDSTYQARVDLARREHETAEAERRRACLAAQRAGRELDRMRRLADDEIVSTDLLDEVENGKMTADAACVAAQAAASRARASVNVAESELKKTVLRAPFDGVIADVTIEVGEWTTPSPPTMPVPAVIDMLDPSSVYISAPMNEVDSARIRRGQPARVTVDSHRDQSFAAQVARVAPYVLDIEQQNRTVEIEVDLDDSDFAAQLLPGTSADVEVILEVRHDVLRVPTPALVEGSKVLVLDGGIIAEREVETGLRNWDFTEIVSGLAEGEPVILSLDDAAVKAGAEAVAAAS